MSAIDQFKKQGGKKLIKQYIKGGTLFTAAGQFILLGKSRTALEILRLSTTLKTKRKLEKKYKKTLLDFDNRYDDSIMHCQSNKIWICWLQGIENAPDLVQRCFKSVKENNPDKEVVVITSENIKDYVDFPQYILDKWQKGIISNTHMSDLLRLELLIKYGGMWLDATVYCSGNDIPDYFFDSDLFFFQCLKPGRDGHANYISSWLLSAKSNNKILMAVRELCYEYWKKNNYMTDYFLLHDFMSIVLDFYPEEWNKIMPRDNATPHILLLRLFDKFDEQIWDAIKAQSPFHKLTYKYKEEDASREDTFFTKLFK